MIEYGICSSGTESGFTAKFRNISGEVPWKITHERERDRELATNQRPRNRSV